MKVIALLQNAGANVAYHDPHVPSFATDGIALESVPLAPAEYDAVVIATASDVEVGVEVLPHAHRKVANTAPRPRQATRPIAWLRIEMRELGRSKVFRSDRRATPTA